jgi:ABC-type Mn2+/Zn2+ transport system permease subunit
MSYIGHGMSHAVFGGAVISNIVGIYFYIGAAIWGILSGVLITEINKRYKISRCCNWGCNYCRICNWSIFNEHRSNSF